MQLEVRLSYIVLILEQAPQHSLESQAPQYPPENQAPQYSPKSQFPRYSPESQASSTTFSRKCPNGIERQKAVVAHESATTGVLGKKAPPLEDWLYCLCLPYHSFFLTLVLWSWLPSLLTTHVQHISNFSISPLKNYSSFSHMAVHTVRDYLQQFAPL